MTVWRLGSSDSPGDSVSLRELPPECERHGQVTFCTDYLRRTRERIGNDMDPGREKCTSDEDPFERLIDFLRQWECRLPQKRQETSNAHLPDSAQF